MADAVPYRWNTSAAAEAYDHAAEVIHPCYATVQQEILAHLPFPEDAAFLLVDLGAGSGRLVERVLRRFTSARALLVDQSEPFLAIGERRLAPFAPRVRFVQRRLQENWPTELPTAADVIVSTSAIHHLDSNEKSALFARCYESLAPGGLFLNGDEYRPADDVRYLDLLREWSNHMRAAVDDGRIPASFGRTLDHWYDRNIRRFGEPKTSGDDCHETIGTQVEYLRQAGFAHVETVWAEKLWAVIMALKARTT
jgi:tRNA (cmo5U34)-methyltransferase